ncbi:predicted protein [Histoplasma capsulatum var. duboisii H88]|uniref:Predicted protein n=1 Tax=Ajellomyces capsulatus (strain H88) TaxID=544711 RepID=F0U833_AJEC8|nr:predicted protein [Histoplasma capsulatum var. duboisii H88]
MNLRHFSMLVRAPVKNRRHPSSGNSAMKIVYDLALPFSLSRLNKATRHEVLSFGVLKTNCGARNKGTFIPLIEGGSADGEWLLPTSTSSVRNQDGYFQPQSYTYKTPLAHKFELFRLIFMIKNNSQVICKSLRDLAGCWSKVLIPSTS